VYDVPITRRFMPPVARETRMRLPLLLLAAFLAAPALADEVRIIPPGDADGLLGHIVRALPPDKPPEDIGRLVDVLVDTTGHPVGAVLDFGGFLGVGNRKVAVTWESLQFEPAKDGLTITLAMPADRIRAAPDYKGPAKPVVAVGP
jgi:hypothetical protein